ncbi:hypothetical protein EXN66_Car019146 [Channa argus]|uniref:Orofacial cleft 1 candidate gene 1 protein-like protein n=1 Tax=Channa argus TaxID=215402 RepID=A0A6G1QMJ3_CHAAH|nr:hypothetical protein EXN66_Car019146 [Channa argus]
MGRVHGAGRARGPCLRHRSAHQPELVHDLERSSAVQLEMSWIWWQVGALEKSQAHGLCAVFTPYGKMCKGKGRKEEDKILPAAREVIPSMVLIFQLIGVTGDSSHISSALAWGAFPVSGPNLDVVQGRGEPTTQLDQFRKIEGLISSDLDHWMCNLYFQVKRLPSGTLEGSQSCIGLSIPPHDHPVIPQPEDHYEQHQSQLPLQPASRVQLRPQLYHQQQPYAGPSSKAADPAVVHSHRGSPIHLSAVSACSSSSILEILTPTREVSPTNLLPFQRERGRYSLWESYVLPHKGRIPPQEPFLETQERRAIHAEGQQRVGFTTSTLVKYLKPYFLTPFDCVYDDDSKRLVWKKQCQLLKYPIFNTTSLYARFPNERNLNDGVPYAILPSFLSCKKPIKKTNSCGPSMSGSSAPARQADKQKMQPSMENLSIEEMEEYTFSLKNTHTQSTCCFLYGNQSCQLTDRLTLQCDWLICGDVGVSQSRLRSHWWYRSNEFVSHRHLGLPLPWQPQQLHTGWRSSVQRFGLIMLLLALMWFVRLYLHYFSQWLYLQAIAVPVNKFQFHAHTVDLIYQSSLLHTREELTMVVVGPMTLNVITFLLVLIRWGCQQIFGSPPSFTSKFIMAQAVWTVLDPLAVFAVDAVLGRLAYSPDIPVGDAAKLYWHFYRADQSGVAGVIITLFLYAVLLLLSITILSIYLLRFHNDGHMLDVFQRLTATEGMYFVPEDQELSNQELSYIVKKAEQWRGFNGERRKVAVYDYIWTADDPMPRSAAPRDEPQRECTDPIGNESPSQGETSTHVAVYTLYLSGLKQRFRHFLRQPDGAIVEVIGDIEGVDSAASMVHRPANQREDKTGARSPHQLRKRKKLVGQELFLTALVFLIPETPPLPLHLIESWSTGVRNLQHRLHAQAGEAERWVLATSAFAHRKQH